MSSGASVSALQRLVEQLKLEAGVERIKGSVLDALGMLREIGQALPRDCRLLSGGILSGVESQITQVGQAILHGRRRLAGFEVSQAAAELQQYCIQNACKDALLLGVPAGSNPFREPRSCALL